MRRQHIDITTRTTAGPAAVYAVLADGASWPEWSPISSFDLEPDDDGTQIRWQASFSPVYPGTGALLRLALGRFLRQCAEGLAGYAAERDGVVTPIRRRPAPPPGR